LEIREDGRKKIRKGGGKYLVLSGAEGETELASKNSSCSLQAPRRKEGGLRDFSALGRKTSFGGKEKVVKIVFQQKKVVIAELTRVRHKRGNLHYH